MSGLPRRALRILLALPAVGFLVTGLRFAVAPTEAAKALAMRVGRISCFFGPTDI